MRLPRGFARGDTLLSACWTDGSRESVIEVSIYQADFASRLGGNVVPRIETHDELFLPTSANRGPAAGPRREHLDSRMLLSYFVPVGALALQNKNQRRLADSVALGSERPPQAMARFGSDSPA